MKDNKQDRFQQLILTFDDGTEAVFVGKVVCEEEETKTVIGLRFTKPALLPKAASFEEIKIDNQTCKTI